VSLLDDFIRADAANLGPNWNVVTGIAGTNRIPLVSNAAQESSAAQRGEAWMPDTFGADQEAAVRIKTMAYNGSRIFLFLQMPNPAASTFTGYLFDIVCGFSAFDMQVFRGNSGSYTSLGTDSDPYGGAPFGVGDVLTAQKVGDQITILRNGVAVLGPVTDAAPLSDPDAYIGFGFNANTIAVDQFLGGNLGAGFRPQVIAYLG
jgi:hypothetical protein